MHLCTFPVVFIVIYTSACTVSQRVRTGNSYFRRERRGLKVSRLGWDDISFCANKNRVIGAEAIRGYPIFSVRCPFEIRNFKGSWRASLKIIIILQILRTGCLKLDKYKIIFHIFCVTPKITKMLKLSIEKYCVENKKKKKVLPFEVF